MNNCFTEKRTVELMPEQIKELQPFIDAMFDKKINPNCDMALVAQLWVDPDGLHTLDIVMMDSIGAKEVKEVARQNVRRHK